MADRIKEHDNKDAEESGRPVQLDREPQQDKPGQRPGGQPDVPPPDRPGKDPKPHQNR
jgi:hypothetical protein